MASTKTSKVRVAYLRVNELGRMKEGNRRADHEAFLSRLSRDLDVDLLHPFHVAEKNGSGLYEIIDGQHQHEALIRRGLQEMRVLCIIHPVSTLGDKAHLFAGLNDRVSVRAVDRFLNEYLAGHARELAIVEVLREHGLHVAHGPSDGAISCVKAIGTVYDDDGKAGLARVLWTGITAWGLTSAAVQTNVVAGLGKFYRRHHDHVTADDVRAKLAHYPGGPDHLVANARAARAVHGGTLPTCVAGIVTATYNKGRRSLTLPDWWSA